jgi:hypothetical protein
VGANPDGASPPTRNSSARQKPPTPAGSTTRQRACSAGAGVDVPSQPNSLDIPVLATRPRVLNPSATVDKPTQKHGEAEIPQIRDRAGGR